MLDEPCRRQHGILTRRQALACGLSPGEVRARLSSGRWQRVYQGVYANFTGELPRPAQLWAALLSAGPGAVRGLWRVGGVGRPARPRARRAVPRPAAGQRRGGVGSCRAAVRLGRCT
ncbi:MAG: type IV toxin-antitoxin system AbiEi family antitoxin domain-containing protein [Micromonosporaceae bacterium]|nr:type IV toxin-antitoxin system AbiEi family antitoxin domain-containing protein [Micromonosporaceae bacterium]